MEVETKVCQVCQEEKPLSGYYAAPSNRGGLSHTCKGCTRDRYYELTEGTVTQRYRKDHTVQAVDVETARERYRRVDRERTAALRRAVLRLYGSECACCGETEERFLTIDHVNNDGSLRRRENRSGNRSGPIFYKRILKTKPSDLQVLCLNCNFGKYQNGGNCPHVLQGKMLPAPVIQNQDWYALV